MQQATLKKRQFWIGILISVTCLGVIFILVDPTAIAHSLRTANLPLLVATIGLLIVYLILRAVRWRYMLQQRVPVHRVFHLQNIGFMLTQVLPLRLGDPARAVLVGSEPDLTVGEGLSSMVVERLLDMVVIVALLPFTIAQVPTLPERLRSGATISGFVAIAAVVLLVVMVNFRPKVNQLSRATFDRIPFLDTDTWTTQIDNLLAGLVTLTSWRSGSILLILSFLVWVPLIFAYQLGMQAVGLSPTILMSAFVMCAAAFSIAAPSSPGQVGVFHAGVILAITLLGMDGTKAASFAFLYHAINLTTLILLGLIGLWRTQASFGTVVSQTHSFLKQRTAEKQGA